MKAASQVPSGVLISTSVSTTSTPAAEACPPVAARPAATDFVAMSVAAGLAATGGQASAAGVDVVETEVEIKTPDGTCDAAFIHPKTGSHPGVLLWPDAFGLRPAMRDMAKRLAADG